MNDTMMMLNRSNVGHLDDATVDTTAAAQKPAPKKVNLMKKLVHHLQADALRIRSVENLENTALDDRRSIVTRSTAMSSSTAPSTAAVGKESNGLKKVRSLFRRETTTANGVVDAMVALREVIHLRHLLSCATRPAMIRSLLDPNDSTVPPAVVATSERSTVDTLANLLPEDVLVVISTASNQHPHAAVPAVADRGKDTCQPNRAESLRGRLICLESATKFALPQSTELMERLFPGGIRSVAVLLNVEPDDAAQVDGVLRESAVGLVAALATRLMSQGSRYSTAATHAVVPDSANAIVSLWRNRKVGRMFFRSVTAIASAVRCSLVPSFFRTMVCCAVACQGRFFTVTWAPPICSTEPLDSSLSGMATAAVELIVSAMTGSARDGSRHSIVDTTVASAAAENLVAGQHFVASPTSSSLIALQDTVRLLPCADSTYVVVPGHHLLQFLQTHRCEGSLLTPVIGGTPMQRLQSTLLRLLNSETVESLTRFLARNDAEKHTFLSKLFHFHGVRMLELMRVRHFLHRLVATETTSDSFLDVRDFFVKWLLNEVVSRVLKGMILSQSNPAAAARMSSLVGAAVAAAGGGGSGQRSGRSGSMSFSTVASEGNFVASAATLVYRKFLLSESFVTESLLPQVASRFPSEEETIFVKEELDGQDVVGFLKHRLGLDYQPLCRQFSLQRTSMSFSTTSSDGAAEENTGDKLSSNESVFGGRYEPDPASLLVPPTLLGYTNRDALVASSAPMLKTSSQALATAVHYHASAETESAVLSASLALSVFYAAASVALKLSHSDATFAVSVQMVPLRGRKINLLVIHVIAQLRRILGCQKISDHPKLPQSSSVASGAASGRSTTAVQDSLSRVALRPSEAKLLVAIPVAMWDGGRDSHRDDTHSVAGLVLRSVTDMVWLNRLLIRSCDPLSEIDGMLRGSSTASGATTSAGGEHHGAAATELSHDSRLTLLWSQALAGCEHEQEELVSLFEHSEVARVDEHPEVPHDSMHQGSVGGCASVNDGAQTPGALTVLSTVESLPGTHQRTPRGCPSAQSAVSGPSAASSRNAGVSQCCNRVLAMNEGVAKAFLSLILSRSRWNRLLHLFTAGHGGIPDVGRDGGGISSGNSDEAPRSFILFLEGILLCASTLVVGVTSPSATKPLTPPQPHPPHASGRRESVRTASAAAAASSLSPEKRLDAVPCGVFLDGEEMTRGALFQWSCNLLCFLGISGPMSIARFAAEGSAKQQMLVIEVMRALAEDDARGWLLLLLLNPERERQYLYRCCRESLHQFMWKRFLKNPSQFGDLRDFLRNIFSRDSVFVMSLLERETMRQLRKRRRVAASLSTGPPPRGARGSSSRASVAVVTFDDPKTDLPFSIEPPGRATTGTATGRQEESLNNEGNSSIDNTTASKLDSAAAAAAAAESTEAEDVQTDDPVLSKWATELAASRFAVFMKHVASFAVEHSSRKPHVVVPQNKKNLLAVEVAELRLSLPLLLPALDDGSFICPRCHERFTRRRENIEAEIEEKLKSKKPAHKFDHQAGIQPRASSEAASAVDQGAEAVGVPAAAETMETAGLTSGVDEVGDPTAEGNEGAKQQFRPTAIPSRSDHPSARAASSEELPQLLLDECIRRSNSLPEISTKSTACQNPSAAETTKRSNGESNSSRALVRPNRMRHSHTADNHNQDHHHHLAALRGVPPRYRLRPQPPTGGEMVPAAFRMYAASQRKMLIKSEEEHHPWFVEGRGRSLRELQFGIRNSIYVEMGNRPALLEVLGAGDGDDGAGAAASAGATVRLPAVSPKGTLAANHLTKGGQPQTARSHRFDTASVHSDVAIKLRMIVRQEATLRSHTVEEETRARFALTVMRVAMFSSSGGRGGGGSEGHHRSKGDTFKGKKSKSSATELFGLRSFEL